MGSLIFYFSLFLILIFEGWGVPFGREIGYSIILTLPIVLFSGQIISKKKIYIPFKLSIFLALFLFGTAFSTVFAVNIQKAFEQQIFYLAAVLIFLYVLNNKEDVKKYYIHFIVLSTVTTLCYFIYLNFFLPTRLNFLKPDHAYQFVYRYSQSIGHNPLGAFILIPLVTAFIYLIDKKKVIFLLASILLFGILIATYLRAAYVAFFFSTIGVFLVSKYKHTLSKKIYFLSTFFMLLTILLFFIVTQFNTTIPFISNIQFLLMEKTFLPYKSLLNVRDSYFSQAIQAFSQKPFIGWGSNNFFYISSSLATSPYVIAESSHNIFLDIASENGIFALIGFIGILFLIFKSGVTNLAKTSTSEKAEFFIFFALLVLFQFNFYHKVYFLFLFFITTSALLYKGKKTFIDKYNIVLWLTGVVFIINLVIISAKILYINGQFEISKRVYPIYQGAFEAEINAFPKMEQTGSKNELLRKYYSLYNNDPQSLEFIGTVYIKEHTSEKALNYYLKSLNLNPYNFVLVEKTYYLLNSRLGERMAIQWLRAYIKENNLNNVKVFTEEVMQFTQWCRGKGILL